MGLGHLSSMLCGDRGADDDDGNDDDVATFLSVNDRRIDASTTLAFAASKSKWRSSATDSLLFSLGSR